MTLEEACEILGVERGTPAKDLRRAYLQLLKRHKPDRDPEGFRRLRDAYELLRSTPMELQPFLTPDDDDASCDAMDPVPSPPEATEAVEAAIEEEDLERAFALIMEDEWAANIDSPWVAHLTYRVAQMLVLARPHAFATVEARYPDVLDSGVVWDSDPLLHARAVAEQWYRFKYVHESPEALQNFIERMGFAQGEGRRALALELSDWFWRDVDGALAVLRKIENGANQVGIFLLSLVEDFEQDVDECAAELPRLGPQPTPRAALLPLLGPGSALAVLVGLIGGVLAMSIEVGVATAPSTLIAGIVVAVSVIGVLYLEAVLFEHASRLQRRFLLACLAIDQRPLDAAVGLHGHMFVRHSLAQNLSLELGWHIGRLARLATPSAAARIGRDPA